MNKVELYFDFLAAKRKANQLENQARKVRKMAKNSLGSDLRKLKKCWEGEASSRYILKGDTLVENAEAIAISLENTAATIRTVATRVYQAELKAIELAKNKSYR